MANRGSEVLAKHVEKHGEQTRLAEVLGVHSAMVSRWARGERRPDPKYRGALQEHLAIPWQDWDEPATAAPRDPDDIPTPAETPEPSAA